MKLDSVVALVLTLLIAVPASAVAWEPTKPIEFVIPAGTGGGADQMARLIHGIAEKHRLSPQPLIVVNKSGGAGAEGFLHVKAKKGDAHTIIITLSNLFTTPLAQGTSVQLERPDAGRAPGARPVHPLGQRRHRRPRRRRSTWRSSRSKQCKDRESGQCLMGGTGSKQEDQIVTVQVEQALDAKFTYVPFKGGGEVCVNLVGKHVDSTVNNPAECVSHWKAGRVRPLAVFDPERIAEAEWKEIPTVKEALGADIQYQMLRGHLRRPGMPKEAVDWYVALPEESVRHTRLPGVPATRTRSRAPSPRAPTT